MRCVAAVSGGANVPTVDTGDWEKTGLSFLNYGLGLGTKYLEGEVGGQTPVTPPLSGNTGATSTGSTGSSGSNLASGGTLILVALAALFLLARK